MNKIIAKLIPLILAAISPALKQFMKGLIKTLEEEAAKTSNPWDDMFVAILKEIIYTD